MNDDDLRRLLGTIDGADDDVPPAFADELWRDVRSTMVRGRPDSRRRQTDVIDLVDESSVRRDGAPGRSGSWLSRAAVLVLLVAGVTGIVLLGSDADPRQTDEPTTTATDPTTPSSPPVLEVPAEACLRFEEAGLLAELSRRLSDLEPTVSVVPELETAVDALEIFIRDLEAAVASSADVTESDVAPFRRALDSLEQARLEVEIGELDRARRSVDAATSLVIEALASRC